MAYKVIIADPARKALKKLPREVAQRISDKLKSVSELDDPRSQGKALTGNLKNYWRYRVGDYRLICEIHDDEVIVLLVDIGHRREIYR